MHLACTIRTGSSPPPFQPSMDGPSKQLHTSLIFNWRSYAATVAVLVSKERLRAFVDLDKLGGSALSSSITVHSSLAWPPRTVRGDVWRRSRSGTESYRQWSGTLGQELS